MRKLWEKLNGYYPVNLEWILFLGLFVTFWYPAVHYGQMPAQIPTHFGGSGLPDAWSAKSWGNLLFAPLTLAAIYLFFTGMSIWMAWQSDPKKLLNLPKKTLEKISIEQAEEIRRFILRQLFYLKVLMVAMFLYLSLMTTQASLGQTAGLGWGIWFFMACILAQALYMTVKLHIMVSNRR